LASDAESEVKIAAEFRTRRQLLRHPGLWRIWDAGSELRS